MEGVSEAALKALLFLLRFQTMHLPGCPVAHCLGSICNCGLDKHKVEVERLVEEEAWK